MKKILKKILYESRPVRPKYITLCLGLTHLSPLHLSLNLPYATKKDD
ncbi:MAG: hypothetical protein Q8P06_02065 [Candidatus Azambacteria bacterium]|nr:hypothetical protein [Candidatus Azambacteria bacterium]